MRTIISGFEFESTCSEGARLEFSYSDHDIKNEPMLFNCDKKYAYDNGGPITQDFITTLAHNFNWRNEDWVIDSRVHMAVVKGCYLCIPGWHHDDVPRTRSDGQPDYRSPAYKAEHCCCLVNASIAPTEFAVGNMTFSEVPLGNKYYKEWHPEVEKGIEHGLLKRRIIKDSILTYFDWETWHQGVPATEIGWRFFIRATKNTGRKPTNEIRRQVQIYLPNPVEGW